MDEATSKYSEIVSFNQILSIGNSHTAGYPFYDPVGGGDPESCYQYWLHQCLSKNHTISFNDIVNLGLCGDTSSGIVQRLKNELKRNSYQLVILNGGGNDLGLGIPVQKIIKTLQEGLLSCESREIPVIAMSIPPVNWKGIPKKISQISQKMKNFSLESDLVEFVDIFSALAEENGFQNPNYGIGDGVHLSKEGYRVVGELLCPIVSRTFAEKGRNDKY